MGNLIEKFPANMRGVARANVISGEAALNGSPARKNWAKSCFLSVKISEEETARHRITRSDGA